MKGNLLLVDDEPFLLKSMKFFLMDIADEIFLANDGVEALEILRDNVIHCVVCDINMPKMNGVEFLKEFRSQKKNTPFIFYSAHGNHDLMLLAAKYGVFDFLSKPSLDGLVEIVEKGLQKGCGKINETEKNLESIFISEYQNILTQIKADDT